jgi:hypothetical protein
VEVVLAKLAPVEPMTAALPIASLDSVKDWLRAASLGIVALVIGGIGLLTLRRIRPVVVEQPTTTEVSLTAARRLSLLQEQARANPEAAAEVIKAWLGMKGSGETAAPAAAPNRRAA